MKDDVYSMAPINKTAAIVTNQSGCEISDILTKNEKIENLRASLDAITKKQAVIKKSIKEYSDKLAYLDSLAAEGIYPDQVNCIRKSINQSLSKARFEKNKNGISIHRMGLDLNKLGKPAQNRNLTNYIADIVKQDVTPEKWASIIRRATALALKED